MFVPMTGAGYINLYGRDVTKQENAIQALAEGARELEVRVRERTQALEINNEQLLTEISERTHAQEALRSAYAYNRGLIDASLDPLLTITPEGKIGDVNVATEAVTGYSMDELIGTDFHGYFTDPDKARAGYQQVFERGRCGITSWRSGIKMGILPLYSIMHRFIGMKPEQWRVSSRRRGISHSASKPSRSCNKQTPLCSSANPSEPNACLLKA